MTQEQRQEFEGKHCYQRNAVREHPDELNAVYEKCIGSTFNSRTRTSPGNTFPKYVRIGGKWYNWESCRGGWYMELRWTHQRDLLEMIDQLETALGQIRGETANTVVSEGVRLATIHTFADEVYTELGKDHRVNVMVSHGFGWGNSRSLPIRPKGSVILPDGMLTDREALAGVSEAVLRPGRLDVQIEIPNPGDVERGKMYDHFFPRRKSRRQVFVEDTSGLSMAGVQRNLIRMMNGHTK